jgi:hypothetical protein
MTMEPAMPQDSEALRLRALCVWMARVAGAMSVGLIAVTSVMWLHPEWAVDIARTQWVGKDVDLTLTLGPRLAAAIVSCAHLGLLCWALWIARGLFLSFANGRAFETRTGLDLRQIGGLVAAYGVTTPVAGALMTVAVTIANPPGHRMLSLSLGINDFILGILGVLILVLGHVMAEAARIADDNRQIV